jgi:hypothetical protein
LAPWARDKDTLSRRRARGGGVGGVGGGGRGSGGPRPRPRLRPAARPVRSSASVGRATWRSAARSVRGCRVRL